MNNEPNKKYLKDYDIEKLLNIKKNWLFVFFTEQMVKDLVEDTPPFWSIMAAPKANAINKEISNLAKALEGLSEDARSLVNQAVGGNSYIFGDEPDMVPILLNKLGRIDAQKSLTPRLQLGDDALQQFADFDLKATTYDDGAFVKYLDIIISAAGLSHCPITLARNILER